MRVLFSPWDDEFRSFSESVRESAVLAAPYITREPLERFVGALSAPASVSVRVLTNLDPESLVRGSVDSGALSRFSGSVRSAEIRHVPGLHAKAYVADEHTAIVTSANLTSPGLRRNRELGVVVQDTGAVREIAEDLDAYARLGSVVSGGQLDDIQEKTEEERQRRGSQPEPSPAEEALRSLIPTEPSPLGDAVLALRGGESTTAIFARAVLYALRRGPLPTTEINEIVRLLLPDLCDDRIDRVINGVAFGKKWKHHVRNAQQQLKGRGQVELIDGEWHATPARGSA